MVTWTITDGEEGNKTSQLMGLIGGHGISHLSSAQCLQHKMSLLVRHCNVQDNTRRDIKVLLPPLVDTSKGLANHFGNLHWLNNNPQMN